MLLVLDQAEKYHNIIQVCQGQPQGSGSGLHWGSGDLDDHCCLGNSPHERLFFLLHSIHIYFKCEVCD